MRTCLVFSDATSQRLRSALACPDLLERAAFLLCRQVRTRQTLKLLVYDVLPVAQQHYLHQSAIGMSMTSEAYSAVAKRAARESASVIFVHSHPAGAAFFSSQDDREEPALLEFLQKRVPGRAHGALVVSGERMVGRLHCPRPVPFHVITEWGSQWKVHVCGDSGSRSIFDRSVRAIGAHGQSILRQLVVGIVGAGGTGSATAEVMTRLGVGKLHIFDDDVLEDTNVPRVLGASMGDIGRFKVDVLHDHLIRIGLGTHVEVHRGSIVDCGVAEHLRDCDIVFSCVDKQMPRSIITMHHLHYLAPVIDMGVKIEAPAETISEVWGRVTALTPGGPCLFCRGRISAEGLRLEALSDRERHTQAKQGYAPELDEPAPAVVPYTMGVASLAASELMARLFMPNGHASLGSESLIRLDTGVLRSNAGAQRPGCFCGAMDLLAAGDTDPHLGLAWAPSDLEVADAV